jgi:hypothetical protein
VLQPNGFPAPNTASNDAASQLLRQSLGVQWLGSQTSDEPLSKRLESMSAEIKDLRKTVDELVKTLKDRK